MEWPSPKKVLRLRLVPAYVLGALGLWLADPRPLGFALGLVLVAGGEGLRAWGAGHLVKNDTLTVSGPYAWLRHPLYAGTLLIGLGFIAMAGGPVLWLLPLGILFFFLYYFPYKDRIESARLERLYGEPYALYRAAIPAFLPAASPWRDVGAPRPWSAGRFHANNEGGTAFAVALGVAVLAVRAALPS
jgi:protein-S-isoprenylcysteine O-methyltransferase Ste14